jgi:hypothetical protein
MAPAVLFPLLDALDACAFARGHCGHTGSTALYATTVTDTVAKQCSALLQDATALSSDARRVLAAGVSVLARTAVSIGSPSAAARAAHAITLDVLQSCSAGISDTEECVLSVLSSYHMLSTHSADVLPDLASDGRSVVAAAVALSTPETSPRVHDALCRLLAVLLLKDEAFLSALHEHGADALHMLTSHCAARVCSNGERHPEHSLLVLAAVCCSESLAARVARQALRSVASAHGVIVCSDFVQRTKQLPCAVPLRARFSSGALLLLVQAAACFALAATPADWFALPAAKLAPILSNTGAGVAVLLESLCASVARCASYFVDNAKVLMPALRTQLDSASDPRVVLLCCRLLSSTLRGMSSLTSHPRTSLCCCVDTICCTEFAACGGVAALLAAAQHLQVEDDSHVEVRRVSITFLQRADCSVPR